MQDNNMLNVKVLKLRDDAILPKKSNPLSPGYDLCVCLQNEFALLHPHTTKTFGTGLMIEPPAGYFIALAPYTGTARKRGLQVISCADNGDNPERTELKLIVHNNSDTTQKLANHECVAQLFFLPKQVCNFDLVDFEAELDTE